MANNDFNVGYVLACANLVNLHDQPGMAADVMAQAGISWAEVKRMGLSEYDMRALRLIRQEKASEPFTDAGHAALAAQEKTDGE